MQATVSLESLFQRQVDLAQVSLEHIVHAKEVVAHGKRVYTGNLYLCQVFEMNAFSQYALYQEDIKPILKEYLNKD